jgi:hypothetical protein
MSFRRCVSIISGLILGLVFLVACGQKIPPVPTSTPTSTKQPTAAATADRLPWAGTGQPVPGGQSIHSRSQRSGGDL